MLVLETPFSSFSMVPEKRVPDFAPGVFLPFITACVVTHKHDKHSTNARVTETMYCLEILRYVEDENERLARNGVFAHVGYEHRVDPATGRREIVRFSSMEEAAAYYDENKREYGEGYPADWRMRRLNAHNTWRSDWHPVTKLAYAVCEDGDGVALEPDESEMSEITCFDVGSGGAKRARTGTG